LKLLFSLEATKNKMLIPRVFALIPSAKGDRGTRGAVDYHNDCNVRSMPLVLGHSMLQSGQVATTKEEHKETTTRYVNLYDFDGITFVVHVTLDVR
jgi:hypothetical protein